VNSAALSSFDTNGGGSECVSGHESSRSRWYDLIGLAWFWPKQTSREQPLVAQSGRSEECLLLGVERTCRTGGLKSQFDPQQTSDEARGKAGGCSHLSRKYNGTIPTK
jgi:hypothetical protein